MNILAKKTLPSHYFFPICFPAKQKNTTSVLLGVGGMKPKIGPILKSLGLPSFPVLTSPLSKNQNKFFKKIDFWRLAAHKTKIHQDPPK